MHALQVLQRLLSGQLKPIHRARLDALWAAVLATVTGQSLSITALGKRLGGRTSVKHKIKRVDRLIGNRHLRAERRLLYGAVTRYLLRRTPAPIILIDWSVMTHDMQGNLLRAGVAIGGRTLTLWEELHPRKHLSNRQVQHRFLETLKSLLPEGCRPIIIGDAGFRVPFYRKVEKLGWQWVGRIRSRDRIALESAPEQWIPASSLHHKATTRPRYLGIARWVQSNPMTAALYLIRKPKRGRVGKTAFGKRGRARRHDVPARREKEPWVLVASADFAGCSATRIVGYYRQRMQIEEGFRDTKSATVGVGLEISQSRDPERLANLLLIAALAAVVLWLAGQAAESENHHRQWQSNTIRDRRVYSLIYLGLLVFKYRTPIPTKKRRCSMDRLIAEYTEGVHAA